MKSRQAFVNLINNMTLAERKDVNHSHFDGPYTIANVRRDFPEWHLGRSRFALWAIEVDFPVVSQQVHAAQQHLEDFLLSGYKRQPHITLSICGFPCHNPKHADDFGVDHFEEQMMTLRRTCLKPFEINIGRLTSFSSAPFFHVSDTSNSIAALRACLTSSAPGYPSDNYTPHVTVGLYAGAWPKEQAKMRLNTFPQAELSPCLIQRISLMSYSAFEIGGPLITIADYHFEQATIQWHQPPLFK